MNIFQGIQNLEDLLGTDVGRVNVHSQGPNNIGGLNEFAQEYIDKTMTIIEIGSFAGVSTWVLASHAKKVISIDCWGDFCLGIGDNSDIAPDYDYQLEDVLESYKYMKSMNKNVTTKKGFSKNILKKIKNMSVDGVYIDADHTLDAVYSDITLSYPKIKAKGFIAGHDMGYSGVTGGIRKAFETLDLSFGSIKTFSDTSWVLRLDKV